MTNQPSPAARGRSRLTRSPKKETIIVDSPFAEPRKERSWQATHPAVRATDLELWLQARLSFVVIAGISLIALSLLLTKVSPSKVANIGVPATYLPLLVLVGVCTFSLARLVLNRRRASFVAIASVLLVFVRVHAVSLPITYLIVPTILVLGIELFALLAKKH